jgi:hypothetical protein
MSFGLLTIGQAQDQLFKKDNTKLLVKVTEVSPDEIKYKLFANLNGPVYVVSKTEIALLIYENGQHEVMSASAEPAMQGPAGPVMRPGRMNQADSLKYFGHPSSLALNFFGFANGEVGMIYQRDFIKSNFNVIIPIAIGVARPALTESVYYNNGYGGLKLDQKLFEVGLGINYYPSLRFPVNYYIGPTIKYMQYNCTQSYTYSDPTVSQNYYATKTITQSSVLSSYCYSITNGIIFRTRSRLMLNLFGSLGFRSDQLNNKIIDPVHGSEVQTLRSPINVYFWAGFAVGFCF